MKKILFLALFLLKFFFVGQIFCTVPDSCLKMVIPNDEYQGYWNPDSVKIDSCFDSPTYLSMFAKHWWEIAFKDYYYPFKMKPLPKDSVVHSDAIDPKYESFRRSIDTLETLFGTINIINWNNTNDSSALTYPLFHFGFNTIQSINRVDEKLNNLENIRYISDPYFLHLGNEEEKANTIENRILISNNALFIHFIDETHNVNGHNIKIYNVLGICVLQKTLEQGTAEYAIDVTFLGTGIYFVQIDNKMYKIIIQR